MICSYNKQYAVFKLVHEDLKNTAIRIIKTVLAVATGLALGLSISMAVAMQL